MLHEILLSLSGLQSPIWQPTVRPPGAGNREAFNHYVSPPERAMLETLEHLHHSHVQIIDATARLSRSHASMVCRAVSASVADVHLGAFMNKIIQVESAILQKDAAYVGGYEIVPLSTVVSEFAPWTRRLDWLMVDSATHEIKHQAGYEEAATVRSQHSGSARTRNTYGLLRPPRDGYCPVDRGSEDVDASCVSLGAVRQASYCWV